MSAILLAVCLASGEQIVPPEAASFYARFPNVRFSGIFRDSLEAFLKSESAYKAADFDRADKVLHDFWIKHPPGTPEWAAAYGSGVESGVDPHINVGSPPCYNALRMLTECVAWRKSGVRTMDAATAKMTIVMVGKSRGVEAKNRAELESGQGLLTSHEIEPQLAQKGHQVIHESTWLFREYVEAATEGQLSLKIDIVDLPNLVSPVEASWKERGFAGLSGDAWGPIWEKIPIEKRRETDWWWVLYPSAVPDQYPDFKTAEFVTGGMGVGPDGASPCFIVDDKWLTRRPPHLGAGAYTATERRTYLPQWFQHEFFHHLFRIYPEFGLEKKGHDWFDRSTWPADFSGRLEPDYYEEALRRRFKGSKPSMAMRLLYAAPPASVLNRLRPVDIVGEYRCEPVQNNWHIGRISEDSGSLRWTNAAGATWRLAPNLREGVLETGEDNPYHADARSRVFTVVLERDAKGSHLPKIAGFNFGGSTYRRTGP